LTVPRPEPISPLLFGNEQGIEASYVAMASRTWRGLGLRRSPAAARGPPASAAHGYGDNRHDDDRGRNALAGPASRL